MPRLCSHLIDFFKNLNWSKFLNGIVLTTLLTVFVYFGKDVLIKFTDRETSLSRSKEENDVLDSPSIAICFDPPIKSTAVKRYNLPPDYLTSFIYTATSNYSESIPKIMNESVYELEKDFILETSNFSKEASDNGIFSHIRVHLGENNVPSPNFKIEKIMVEKLYTLFYGMCYIVTPNWKIGYGWVSNIGILMSDSLDPEDIPESIKLFVTSKNNQFGLALNTWLEGNVFDATMPYKKRHYMHLSLKQIKYNYLPLTSNCKEETAYDCVANNIASNIIDQQLSGHNICIPAFCQTFLKLVFNDSFELCEKGEENYHMFMKLWGLLRATNKICPISCVRTEYVGRQNFLKYSLYPGLIFGFLIESTDVQAYQEYLIYDLIGMIASIGGLLGLFLGFSFLNAISYFIDKFFNLINHNQIGML